jgi:hypothetical protein
MILHSPMNMMIMLENYSYHSEELRSPISTDDEKAGNSNDAFPQFNPNVVEISSTVKQIHVVEDHTGW